MKTKQLKSDHPFTAFQLKALNAELQKISNLQIVALRGVSKSQISNYTDIEIKHSPYLLDVFLSFIDISVPDQPKSFLYKIATDGKVDYNARSSMSFNSLSDRVSFFNLLTPVNFK
ncbi:hypothetical protein [Bizionia myxarmorum]|uniref:Uncharacterized protein n=1 Tax=Bizionia myxarmorum TaxID=291186 RepID=A0A5D0RCB6_9FLAO|nr:hypothetical protein [Bizionia myxarmorum]TYB78348.1 hypothetical protein ES674_00780 [Bizionia myxarmorum]